MDSIRKVFSFRLRELRGDLTQEQFAERLGLSHRTYQEMESGNIPQRKTIEKIISRLGLDSETSLFLDPDLVDAMSSEEIREMRTENRQLKRLVAAQDAEIQALKSHRSVELPESPESDEPTLRSGEESVLPKDLAHDLINRLPDNMLMRLLRDYTRWADEPKARRTGTRRR